MDCTRIANRWRDLYCVRKSPDDDSQRWASERSYSYTESTSESEETEFPEAPDGGYGWVVVFAAFMVHLIADGISFSFGVLYPKIQDQFKALKSESALVGSIFMAMPLIASPVSSALIDRYECRAVIIAGGLLGFAGFFISQFAASIFTLSLSFGFFAGLGFSFCFTAAIVAVTYYFERRRAMATGIAVCGSGLGTFLFAPFVEFLLSTYEWKGALMILSAVALNLTVCGALIRDLQWPEDTYEYKKRKFLRSLNDSTHLHNSSVASLLDQRHAQSSVLLCKSGVTKEMRRAISLPEIFLDVHPSPFSMSLCGPLDHLDGQRWDSVNGKCRDKLLPNATSDATDDHCVEFVVGNQEQSQNPKSRENGCVAQPSTSIGEDDVFIVPDQRNRKVRRSHRYQADTYGYARSQRWRQLADFPRYSARILSAPAVVLKVKPKKRLNLCCMLTSVGDIALDYLKLLKDSSFVIFLISNFLLYALYDIPYINMPEFAMEKLSVTEESSSMLISIIGIVNMLAMLLFGVLADRDFVNNTLFYGVSTCLCGLSIVLVPWVNTYWQFCLISAVFGFFISANYTLTSVILVDLMSLSDFVYSYGVMCMVQGFGTLIGPPLAGALYDMTQNYNATFYAGGCGTVMSGVLVLCIFMQKRRERTRRVVE
ncbi:hypothetical protein M514_02965 [Trichuris suis]|uniref:Major facilitator superfamily (MFS) profile domain-containing protein n=1 Tax=Trichuris suis TaxID=68888 RepID=A0A085NI60_9BILA|nr:hypothetical protein M514_02965 [Trichuris suis]